MLVNFNQTCYLLDGHPATLPDKSKPICNDKGQILGFPPGDATFRQLAVEYLTAIPDGAKDLSNDDFWKSGLLMHRVGKSADPVELSVDEAVTIKNAVRHNCPNMQIALEIFALVEGKQVSGPS